MRLWKQWYARIEPHVNRALLVAILICLVVLLTYLLGGAGAFFALRQLTRADAAAPPAASATSTRSAATSGISVTLAGGTVALALRVSPLDLPYNCALGATAAQVVTLTNPDSVTHHATLSWNGVSGVAQGFSASLQQSTVPAHESRLVTITGLAQLLLNPSLTSQYLWISDDTSGAATVVAKVHVWCATSPLP